MKGLSSEAVNIESIHVSADFMRDSGVQTVKRDTRVTLRYEDGKAVLPSAERVSEEDKDEEHSEEDTESDGEDGETKVGGVVDGNDEEEEEEEEERKRMMRKRMMRRRRRKRRMRMRRKRRLKVKDIVILVLI